jgi:hypothetical protein
LDTFFNTFHVGILNQKEKMVSRVSNLPPPPKNWRELQKHPLKSLFIFAIRGEINKVEAMATYQKVKRPDPPTQILPVMWVFTYKEDPQGLLVKCKARLCVRGDLQRKTDQDTRAATLAARSFRILIVIVAAFNLEIEQYNTINAFVNSFLNERVYQEPGKFRGSRNSTSSTPGPLWLMQIATSMAESSD